jgi:ATP-binding cassette subfamily B protein
MKNFQTVKPYIIENAYALFLGLLSLIMVDLFQLIIPRIIKWAIDDLTIGIITSSNLLRYALYLFGISLLIGVFRYFWRYFLFGTSRKIEESLRNRLFSHLQTLSLNYFHETKTGDLMAHATNDIDAVRMAFGIGLVAITDGLILGIFSIAFMVYINPILTLFAVLPMPLIALLTFKFSPLLHQRYEQVQATFSLLTEKVRESVAGIRVIKAYVQEDKNLMGFEKISKEYVKENMYLLKIWGMLFPVIMFVSNLGIGIILLLGGSMTIFQTITPGDFVAFSSYLGLLTWPMMAIGWVITLVQRARASMGRINSILNAQPEIRDEANKVIGLKHLKGEIVFRDLTFSFHEDSKPVLKNISFTVKPGETIAIVGRIGAGKTTLLNLIPRLYDPPFNSIFIDGHEIHQISLDTLRRSIGYAPQDTFIFSDTFKENIIFGNIKAQEEEVIEAANDAQLYDEIMSYPDRLSTIIGEKGITLSGGQKQRLAISRTLLSNTPILILDDVLSSVDTQTEERILKGLRKAMEERTNLIVSHRLSSIKDADRIYVLDEGEIREQGNHEELIKKNGIYANLWSKQRLEIELEEEGDIEVVHAR